MENNNQTGVLGGQATPLPNPILGQQPKPKMKRWKKVLLWVFGVLVFLGVIAFNLPRILSLMFPGDAQLVDDSAIRLQKVSVPDADNGFFDLNSITTDMIKLPADDPNFDLEYTNYASSTPWSQTKVDQVLAENQQVLDLFSQAAGKQFIQIPDYADPSNVDANTQLYPLNVWRQAARLQAIKALSLSWQGKTGEALQEAVKLNEVGHKILDSDSDFIEGLVAISMQQLGSGTVLQILPYGSLDSVALQNIDQRLSLSSDNQTGYQNMFKYEYVVQINTLQHQIIDNLDKLTSEDLKYASDNLGSDAIKYSKYGYYFKPNQTKNLFAGLAKVQVQSAGNRCELNDFEQTLLQQQKVTTAIIFQENAIGKLLYKTVGLTLGSSLTNECKNDLVSNVAQIQLALKSYQNDNSSLPATLNALVPKYLTSVPLDPFDHQPIRYNAEKKILYSVGLNKKDLGGSTGNDWTKMDNPTFPINFQPSISSLSANILPPLDNQISYSDKVVSFFYPLAWQIKKVLNGGVNYKIDFTDSKTNKLVGVVFVFSKTVPSNDISSDSLLPAKFSDYESSMEGLATVIPGSAISNKKNFNIGSHQGVSFDFYSQPSKLYSVEANIDTGDYYISIVFNSLNAEDVQIFHDLIATIRLP